MRKGRGENAQWGAFVKRESDRKGGMGAKMLHFLTSYLPKVGDVGFAETVR